jgi:methionyl-tRNA formyltransferase
MERAALLPGFVLLLEQKAAGLLPGQTGASGTPADPDAVGHGEDCWSHARFDPGLPARAVLDRCGIPYAVSESADINDTAVVRAIGERPESVFVFSGFGGVLLRQDILATGKRFLHVHGGYLPDFKGSTTNYFSLLAENTFGASSLFLSAEIDSGPVLLRRKFPPPPDRTKIDHVYDSAARALVLIETLQNYVSSGSWQFELPENSAGEIYYIIHPVLKHIAILGSDGGK